MVTLKALIAGVAVLAAAGCGASTGGASPPTGATFDGSVAQNATALAKFDGNKFSPALYAAGIEALQPACTETPTGIAALADSGYQDLVKNGITTDTRLGVLGELRESIPATLPKQSCVDILSEYLVMRETPSAAPTGQ